MDEFIASLIPKVINKETCSVCLIKLSNLHLIFVPTNCNYDVIYCFAEANKFLTPVVLIIIAT